MVEPETPQKTIQYGAYVLRAEKGYTRARAHIPTRRHWGTRDRACTRTHKCAIIIAFPPQQWFFKRASMLRHTILPVLFNINAAGFTIVV
jgi:hypothetical protein